MRSEKDNAEKRSAQRFAEETRHILAYGFVDGLR